MGAYKCPACRGTDIGDNAGGLKCLGCGVGLKFVGGPAVALLDGSEPAATLPHETVPVIAPEPVEAAPEDSAEDSAEPVEELSGE